MSAQVSWKQAPQVASAFRGATRAETRQEGRPRKRPPPFSLRLTAAERAQLEAQAGTQPLGTYIRSRLFDGKAPKRPRATARPVQDQQALSQLLALLGSLRLSNNLNQLAKAANCGALPVDEGVEKELSDACAEIRWMRQILMSALGLKA